MIPFPPAPENFWWILSRPRGRSAWWWIIALSSTWFLRIDGNASVWGQKIFPESYISEHCRCRTSWWSSTWLSWPRLSCNCTRSSRPFRWISSRNTRSSSPSSTAEKRTRTLITPDREGRGGTKLTEEEEGEEQSCNCKIFREREILRKPGGQFNSFVEISTDFSTEFL